MRPGPAQLEPGLAPNGLVIHVYSVPGGRLILERRLTDPDEAEWTAPVDAAQVAAVVPDSAVCLVIYDGDTGRRWTAEEVARTDGAAGSHSYREVW